MGQYTLSTVWNVVQEERIALTELPPGTFEAGNKQTKRISTHSRLRGPLFCFVLSKALNLLPKSFFFCCCFKTRIQLQDKPQCWLKQIPVLRVGPCCCSSTSSGLFYLQAATFTATPKYPTALQDEKTLGSAPDIRLASLAGLAGSSAPLPPPAMAFQPPWQVGFFCFFSPQSGFCYTRRRARRKHNEDVRRAVWQAKKVARWKRGQNN